MFTALSFTIKIAILGTVFLTVMIAMYGWKRVKSRGTALAGDISQGTAQVTQDALYALEHPVETSEKILSQATSFWKAMKTEPQVMLSLGFLLLILMNDLMFGFFTLGNYFPIIVGLIFALGFSFLDLSTFANIFNSDNGEGEAFSKKRGMKQKAMVFFGLVTTFVAGYGNGIFLQKKMTINSASFAGDYRSLEADKVRLDKSIASLNDQAIRQSNLISETTHEVAAQSKTGCKRLCRAAMARETNQRAALKDIRMQLEEDRLSLKRVKKEVAGLRVSGRTSAGENIGDIFNLPIFLGLFMSGAMLQWALGADEFGEFKSARLHSAAQKIKDNHGEDTLKKALLSSNRKTQKTAMETVDFSAVETVHKIVVEKREDVPKTPQTRDIIRVFTDSYVIKDDSKFLSMDELFKAYQILENKEAAAMTRTLAQTIMVDAIRYLEDVEIVQNGMIRGWKPNPSKIEA